MSDPIVISAAAATSATRLLPFAALAFLGLFLLYGVGFAQPELLHNIAHDGRHAFAFPCH